MSILSLAAASCGDDGTTLAEPEATSERAVAPASVSTSTISPSTTVMAPPRTMAVSVTTSAPLPGQQTTTTPVGPVPTLVEPTTLPVLLTLDGPPPVELRGAVAGNMVTAAVGGLGRVLPTGSQTGFSTTFELGRLDERPAISEGFISAVEGSGTFYLVVAPTGSEIRFSGSRQRTVSVGPGVDAALFLVGQPGDLTVSVGGRVVRSVHAEPIKMPQG